MQGPDYERLTCLDEFEIRGEWWIAGASRRKVTGTLRVNRRHYRLDLDGVFYQPKKPLIPTNVTIVGAASDGQLITLVHCQWTRDDGVSTSYAVNTIAIGAILRNLRTTRFRAFQIRTTDLEEWASIQPFKPTFPTGGVNRRVVGVTYNEPDPIHVELPKHKMRLRLESSVEAHFQRVSAVAFEHECHLVCLFDRPVRWGRLMRAVGDVQDLLTLFTATPVTILRLTASPVSQAGLPEQHVLILQRHLGDVTRPKVYSPQMPFPLVLLKDNAADVMSNWFDLLKRGRAICNVFFANFRTPPPYLETRFFHLAQCLEGFHRSVLARGTGKHVTPRRMRQLHTRIASNLPKMPVTLMADVKRVLWNANEFSFFERLTRLMESLETASAAIVTNDPASFIRAIRDTRNLFTHLEARKGSKAFQPHEWDAACVKMEMWLFMVILKQCGISEELIRNRIASSMRFCVAPLVLTGPNAAEVEAR